MSVCLPGANNLGTFWRRLNGSQDMLSQLPPYVRAGYVPPKVGGPPSVAAIIPDGGAWISRKGVVQEDGASAEVLKRIGVSVEAAQRMGREQVRDRYTHTYALLHWANSDPAPVR